MKRRWALFFLLLPGLLCAKVYKTVDKQGGVLFSDQPGSGTEVFLPEDANLSWKVDASFQEPDEGNSKNAPLLEEKYTQLVVTSPSAGQFIHDNNGRVPVQLFLDPSLMRDHKIRVIVDGSSFGELHYSSSFALLDVLRGKHSLAVQILDKTNKMVKTSPAVTFFMYRAIKHKVIPIGSSKSSK